MFITTLTTNPVYFFRVVVIVIISVTLHELAHGWAAMSQGDDTPERTGHLTLNPVVHMGWESIIFLCLAGIAWGKMPVNPYKFRWGKLSNILVSGAGPFSNLVIAILCISLCKLFLYSPLREIASIQFVYMAARINLVLFLFNLIPLPPLDGFYVFSEIFPRLKALENTQFASLGLFLLFLIPGIGAALGSIASWIISISLQ